MATFYTDTASIELLSVTTLTALTSSIQYITSSQLNVGTNVITVNTTTPLRYGGIAVADSGSTPITSGSLFFDSQNNQWIFVHQQDTGAPTTSSVLIMGPQTFNDIGNETTIIANRLTKGQLGDLGEHITSSNVTDTGTLVSINSNTHVTGSFIVTAGITGSLQGTATTASNITPAISNDVDTRLVTTNGNGTLNGEGNLTFNGSTLAVTGNVTATSVTGSFSGDGSGLTNLPSTSGTNIGTVLAITRITYPFSGF